MSCISCSRSSPNAAKIILTRVVEVHQDNSECRTAAVCTMCGMERYMKMHMKMHMKNEHGQSADNLHTPSARVGW
jgi:hypothetical protein